MPDISVGEPRVHRQSTEIFDRPHTGNRLPGSRCRLRSDGAQITGFKDQEHPIRCQSAAPNGSAHGSGSVKTAGQVDPFNPCNKGSPPPPPPLLQTPPSMPASCLAASAGLFPARPSNKRGERRFELVGHSPNFMELKVHHSRQSHDRDGCLQHRLGCPVRQPAEGRTVVSDRGENAHQLPRASRSNLGISGICQEAGEHPGSSQDGEHVCPDVHQQDGRYSLPRPQSAHQGSLDLVPSQEHHPQGLSPSTCSQREGRRGIKEHERSYRLDAQQGNIQEISNTVWTPGHRFVSVETDETTFDFCQLAARPTGSGDRRLLNELERSEGIRQAPLALDQSSFTSSQGTSGNHCSGGASVENPSLVLPTVGVADRDTPQTSQDKKTDSANTPSQLPRHTTPPSRVAYLRARFSAERILPQASSLLLASWREKSGRTYDSLFGKWASWCVEVNIDPTSGNITGVVNFLANLFHRGYQHRSLCSYRSAISSLREKVDRQPIGSQTSLFSNMGRIGGYKPYRVPGRQPEPGFRRPDTEACDASGTVKAIQIDRPDKSGHPFQTL